MQGAEEAYTGRGETLSEDVMIRQKLKLEVGPWAVRGERMDLTIG